MHDPNPNTVVSFALTEEAGGLLDQLQGVRKTVWNDVVEYRGIYHDQRTSSAFPVLVYLTGIGASQARQVVDRVLSHQRPNWWVAAGFAGGLVESLQPCDLVMAQCLVDATSGQRLDTGVRPAPTPPDSGPTIGDFVTVPEILGTPSDKRACADRTGAIACDMESFAIADACRQHGTRCLCLRIISDTVHETLPPELAKIAQQPTWTKRLGAAASAIWTRPRAAQDLWNLQQRAWDGSHQLGTHLLQSVLPALAQQVAPPATDSDLPHATREAEHE